MKWASHPDYPYYLASSEGQIYSKKSKKILKQYIHSASGYASVSLRRLNGPVHQMKAQKFIMLAFHGPRPDGLCICHNNGIRTDNRPSNLRYDTWSSNQIDRVKHGTSNRGERCGGAKLKQADIPKIFELKKAQTKQCDIARLFNVSDTTISMVLNKKSWSYA